MYVTRRLLRSTLEEATADKSEALTDENHTVSPRKRRPLLQTSKTPAHHSESIKSNKPSGAITSKKSTGANISMTAKEEPPAEEATTIRKPAPLPGLGLLIDARDSQDRWCEAKILRLNAANKKVLIHYVGWNSRYDCWLEAKFVAAHGSKTKAKTKAGSSWNGRDSLFGDISIGKKSTKKKSEPTIKVEVPSSSKSNKKKRPGEDDGSPAMGGANKRPKVSPAAKRSSKRAAAKIQVGVDALDEESERSSRRGRKDKVDLELEMEVQADPTSRANNPDVGPKTPTRRTRSTPVAKPPPITVKSPKAVQAQPARKPSPRLPAGVGIEANSESDAAVAVAPMSSPTVGMSILRRSARATLAAQNAGKKKRKKTGGDDDDSDEEFKLEEDEEDEDDDEDDDDEGDEEDEEEQVEESDDEVAPVRRTGGPSGNARRRSSSSSLSAPRRISSGGISQWQMDPAFSATRERLSTIFRQRLMQRGELGAGFQGSFQQAMSGSSAASTPRTPLAQSDAAEEDEDEDEQEEASPRPKKKKKTKRAAVPTMDEEEKAAAARFYYAQHYYQMQAYQYQQYMYQQALMVQQLELQGAAASESKTEREAASKDQEEDKKDEEEDTVKSPRSSPASSSPQSRDEPVMNGGIIDPRFIHARMDALDQQRRMRQELYYQHYNQATVRNLQILAASPQLLHEHANVWRDQVRNDHASTLDGPDSPKNNDTTDENNGDDMEEKRPVDANTDMATPNKHDEPRQVEDTSRTELASATAGGGALNAVSPSRSTTPEAAENKASSEQAGHSPSSPDSQEIGSDSSSAQVQQDPAKAAPSESASKTEAVLFELVL